MNNISTWWNEAGEDALHRLCDYLGWPHQYADGEWDREWLTPDQMASVMAIPEDVLSSFEDKEQA